MLTNPSDSTYLSSPSHIITAAGLSPRFYVGTGNVTSGCQAYTTDFYPLSHLPSHALCSSNVVWICTWMFSFFRKDYRICHSCARFLVSRFQVNVKIIKSWVLLYINCSSQNKELLGYAPEWLWVLSPTMVLGMIFLLWCRPSYQLETGLLLL